MTKTYELGLTKDIAIDILEQWLTKLNRNEKTQANYGLSTKLKCSAGLTTTNPTRRPTVAIGIKHLSTFTNKVPDQNFAQVAIAIFHEARHVEQDYEIKQARPTLTDSLFINILAYRNNPRLRKALYQHNIQEIDAEQNGIHNAAKHLKAMFPNMDCERLVLDCVNESNKHHGYWLHTVTAEELQTLDDVSKAFRIAKKQAINEPNNHQPRRKVSAFLNRDTYVQIFKGPEHDRQLWSQVNKELTHAYNHRPSIEFEQMLATLNLYARPHYVQQYYPAATKLGLTPEQTFQNPFPETQSDLMARLHIPAPVLHRENAECQKRQSQTTMQQDLKRQQAILLSKRGPAWVSECTGPEFTDQYGQ